MNMRLILLLGLVAIFASFILADATTYDVGKDGIWDFPPSNDEYNNWALTIDFKVGDVLVFDFLTRTHDVSIVTKEKYENCDGDSSLALGTDGPARITLTATGFNYFICTLQEGGHCTSGLRLAVNVNVAANANGTTAPPTSSTPTHSPSPSPTWITSPSPSPSYVSSAHIYGGSGCILLGGFDQDHCHRDHIGLGSKFGTVKTCFFLVAPASSELK